MYRGADGEASQFLGTVVPRTVLETFLASQDAPLKHLQDAASLRSTRVHTAAGPAARRRTHSRLNA